MGLILVSEVDGQSQKMGQAGTPPELAAGTEAALELEAQGFDRPTAAGNLAPMPPLIVHVVVVAFEVA
ncbi:MAG: hypothetical protein KDM81_03535, partial [Verrucomicrobiae bacterium]|nr:hypothetical protein [Verrucomicrobiae bacterium]